MIVELKDKQLIKIDEKFYIVKFNKTRPSLKFQGFTTEELIRKLKEVNNE